MNDEKNSSLDLETFRARFERVSERTYWRTLEELEDPEAFDAFVADEFPQQALPLEQGVDRRDFMKLMSSSLALAGLAACAPPAEKIVPYVRQPEDYIPGRPTFFSTAMVHDGAAIGLLVESHDGRPTKIEGNPDHPASLGATDAFAQASVLQLYDPDRSQAIRHLGNIATWDNYLNATAPVISSIRDSGGSGLAILTETVVSPTFGEQMRSLLAQLPGAKWHQWEPDNHDSEREGSRLAFGGYVNTLYDFTRADVVLAIDSDFLASGPGCVRYARDFMSRRRIRAGSTAMNRLYALQSTPTPTGSIADNRLILRPSEIEQFAYALHEMLTGGASGRGVNQQWLSAVARDLRSHAGSSVVIAGPNQPPHVHAIVHAINAALGNAGTTVIYTDPVETAPVVQRESLAELVRDIDAGAVRFLLILGGNPVFTAPADMNFGERLDKVPLRAHLSLYYDDTSYRCHWHIPKTHYLEEWSDARAHDGTVSIIQPLIAPLYAGRSAHELIAALTGESATPYEIIRGYWQQRLAGDFDASWREALRAGLVAGSAFAPRGISAFGTTVPPAPAEASDWEIVFRADPTIHDGRFANNAWLQELPKPLSKITWDNYAAIGVKTAREKNLHNEDLVEISFKGRTVRAPIWILPGHAENTVTVYYGYGSSRGGSVAKGHGFNGYAIRTSDSLSHGRGAEITRSGGRHRLATTQMHQVIPQEREILRSGTIAEYVKDPSLQRIHHPDFGDISLYPHWKSETGYSWGMVIDTTVCTGCSGCVVACHAENNIAVVGKEQVLIGREMHWLRIDNYYKGNPENPDNFNQPMLCQHCENAPCEPVCPVEATSHSTEGINEMTYNRCVGTRYCANNCPYKVRRFNYFEFNDWKTEVRKLQRNPDVTVRSRGVMEKCSFCIQRVNEARIEAEKENRRIADGELVTACQAACPTQAISFGNIDDPQSQVSLLKKEPHNFQVLEEVNTRPRASYLATVRNPNPELITQMTHGREHE